MLAGDIFAWAVFLGITVVGIASTWIGTLKVHGHLTKHVSESVRLVLTSTSAVLLFLGGWILFDVWQGGRRIWMLHKKLSGLPRQSTTDPV